MFLYIEYHIDRIYSDSFSICSLYRLYKWPYVDIEIRKGEIGFVQLYFAPSDKTYILCAIYNIVCESNEAQTV